MHDPHEHHPVFPALLRKHKSWIYRCDITGFWLPLNKCYIEQTELCLVDLLVKQINLGQVSSQNGCFNVKSSITLLLIYYYIFIFNQWIWDVIVMRPDDLRGASGLTSMSGSGFSLSFCFLITHWSQIWPTPHKHKLSQLKQWKHS